MKRHQLNALYYFIIAALHLYCSEAAVCNPWFGPAGVTECVKFPHYTGYQWATCRTSTYIKTISKGRHRCLLSSLRYCLYQCMLEDYDRNYGNVFSYCACSPYSTQPIESVKLPDWCYSPNGTDCSWYTECLNKAYPKCEKSEDDDGIQYAQTFCELYNQNYNNLSSKGKQWINAVRKCLQVKLVPMLDKRRSKTCKELKSEAFGTHTPCYLNPDESSLSYCNLSITDQLRVFWTIKAAYIQSFLPSLKDTLSVLRQCNEGKTNKLVQSTKLKIEEAVKEITDRTFDITKREIKNIIKELEQRIKTWLQNPTPVPIQLDMFIKDDDWSKFSKRGKRSVTEDDEELARSYIAGKIVDAVALDQNWKENGVAWFAYANNETLQDADGNFTSIRLLVADRFKYDLVTENSKSPLKQSVDLATILVDLSEAVLKGVQNISVDGNSIDITKVNGCLDWDCKTPAFNVTSLKLYERNEGTEPLNHTKHCIAFYLHTLFFFMIAFLCIT